MAVKDFRQVIHDLRNRIAPIRNVLYLLKMRGTGDQKLADAVAIIERQVDAMSELLTEVSTEGIAATPAASATASHSASSIAPSPPMSSTAPAPPSKSEGSRRILVADDSPAVCESFGSILRDLGHEVRVAHDGQQAVDMATAWAPDFVMLDVNMPKINGYEAARRLRAQFPSSKMRLVMISGTNIDDAVLQAARQAGFDQCLDKLLDFSALQSVLAA